MPKLLKELQLFDIAQKSKEVIVGDFGGSTKVLSEEEYIQILTRVGFESIETQKYISPLLHRIIYLMGDLEILFAMSVKNNFYHHNLMEHYKKVIIEVLSPLISNDRHLCGQHNSGCFSFVIARKSGEYSQENTTTDLRNKFICPASRQALFPGNIFFETADKSHNYPVINDIPLLMPVYELLWNRQKTNSSTKKEFKYESPYLKT